jgi:replicative DNA helicase
VTDTTTSAYRALARLAASYADRGWRVLPTSLRKPVLKDWENEASGDPDEARACFSTPGHNPEEGAWRGYNVGIATGPSNLVVVDLDTKNGKNGISSFKALIEELGADYEKVCDTYTVTTPSGGLHLYYESPPGVEIRLSASQLASGVDIRAWGGMVVAAGSVIDGAVYAVINNRDPAPLPPLVTERLLALPSSKSRASKAERIPEIIPQGERESVLVSLAGSMRRRGASVEAIFAALEVENETRCIPPVSRADLERISNSMGRYDPADPPPGVEDDIEPDPDLLAKTLVQLETMRVAQDTMKARAMRRQREILGGMSEPMNVLDFVAAGPDPVATCIWGVPKAGGVMAWAENQGVIVAGPPGTGKSTIALQVILRRVGILEGDVLGMPVIPSEEPLVYLALDRADQIRQSIRRMVPPSSAIEAVKRLLMIDNLPPSVDLRQVESFIGWLQGVGAKGVVMDSAKDLGFDLNDSSEGQAFNFLVQATLRAGVQIFVTHHSRKVPRGDRKPLTLNDLHGSQWVAAGAGSVIMLDGEAGPNPKRLVHVKPLTVPMSPLLLELDHETGEVQYRDDDEDREEGGQYKKRTGGLQKMILDLLAEETEPLSGEAIARLLESNSGSVSKSLKTLADRDLVQKGDGGWTLPRPRRAATG